MREGRPGVAGHNWMTAKTAPVGQPAHGVRDRDATHGRLRRRVPLWPRRYGISALPSTDCETSRLVSAQSLVAGLGLSRHAVMTVDAKVGGPSGCGRGVGGDLDPGVDDRVRGHSADDEPAEQLGGVHGGVARAEQPVDLSLPARGLLPDAEPALSASVMRRGRRARDGGRLGRGFTLPYRPSSACAAAATETIAASISSLSRPCGGLGASACMPARLALNASTTASGVTARSARSACAWATFAQYSHVGVM